MSNINAVIGVAYNATQTLYVKRSDKMENYPETWSLFSIQFLPENFKDIKDLKLAQKLFDKLSMERLHNTPICVEKYLTSGRCSNNPMKKMVTLHLYRISFPINPQLNKHYYSDYKWLTPEEYENLSNNTGKLCGLCTKLWTGYSIKNELF
jgi:hypothetical protein